MKPFVFLGTDFIFDFTLGLSLILLVLHIGYGTGS